MRSGFPILSRNHKYPQYERASGWNALLPARTDIQTLSNDVACDVVVIGAGYTGIAVARRWAELEPDKTILVLDASELGEGTPGRNSGFLLEIALAGDADPRQVERMRDCNQLIAATMADLKGMVTKYAIDCDLERSGTYRAAAGRAGIQALSQYRAFLDVAQLSYESLDRKELSRRLGTRFYQSGLYSPHCYLAQPAALIRGLAQNLPDSVSIYERSPALELKSIANGWQVVTPGGTVRARYAIVANNAFCKGLGVGNSRVAAIYTYAGLTEPLSAESLQQLGMETSWGLLPAHRLGSTLRRTTDGRLLIRAFYDYEAETDNHVIEERLQQCLQRRFPQLGEPTFASVWSGATGFTYNGASLWGEVAPGLYVSAGYNGGGVVKGSLFGRLLADLANGKSVPDMKALFGMASWMLPDPLRRLGFHLVSAIESRRGQSEV